MQAVYFMIGFLAILATYIFFIVLLAKRLNGKVPYSTYNLIEKIIIGGIILGIIGMFQPWIHVGFRVGFHVLLFSTLTYIVWSHITPRPTQYDEAEAGEAPVNELQSG